MIKLTRTASAGGMRRPLQQGERVDTSLGFGGLNRGHEVSQKQPEVGVAWVKSQPRHSALRLLRRQPLRQKRGLTEPSRCREEDQPRLYAPVRAQLVSEAGALHQPATRRGQMQLGAQHRHSVIVGPLFAQRMSERL